MFCFSLVELCASKTASSYVETSSLNFSFKILVIFLRDNYRVSFERIYERSEHPVTLRHDEINIF